MAPLFLNLRERGEGYIEGY